MKKLSGYWSSKQAGWARWDLSSPGVLNTKLYTTPGLVLLSLSGISNVSLQLLPIEFSSTSSQASRGLLWGDVSLWFSQEFVSARNITIEKHYEESHSIRTRLGTSEQSRCAIAEDKSVCGSDLLQSLQQSPRGELGEDPYCMEIAFRRDCRISL